MRIVIDVDLCVVDISKGWLDYLDAYYKQVTDIPEENIEYNLSKYYTVQDHKFAHNIDMMCNYWDWTNLYDYAQPLPYTQDVITKWIANGHDVVFVSMVRGGHFQSKKLFIEKYFKGSSFVATDRKDLIPCDVFIDDRNNFLNMAYAKYKFKVKTPYTQDVDLIADYTEVCNFNEIQRFLNLTGHFQ